MSHCVDYYYVLLIINGVVIVVAEFITCYMGWMYTERDMNIYCNYDKYSDNI